VFPGAICGGAASQPAAEEAVEEGDFGKTAGKSDSENGSIRKLHLAMEMPAGAFARDALGMAGIEQ
jgi:hypothetical protein